MPLPISLVVKNGSKILSMISVGMPVPVSVDLDHHVVGRRHRLVGQRLAFLRGDVRGAHGELAAVRHGVARIHREIHHHLLELRHVGLHRPQVAPVHQLERRPSRRAAARSSMVEVGQRLAEIEHLRPQRLAAREREQLPHQARGPVGVLLDLHDVVERRIGRLVRVEQEVGRHHDGGEHVVEVVRDAAGELADGLHLLHLRDLLLQLAHFGGLDRVDDRRLAVLLASPRPPRRRSAPSGCPRRRAPRRPARCRPARRPPCAIAASSAARSRSATTVRIERPSAGSASPLSTPCCSRTNGALARAILPGLVDRRDRHRRVVEEAHEAHFGGARRIGHLLARAVEHQRARGARRAVGRERDLVIEPHRHGPAAARLEVEVVHLGLDVARLARQRREQRARRRPPRCRRASARRSRPARGRSRASRPASR